MFRLMVGLGLLMIAIGWVGAWLWWRQCLPSTRWFLRPLAHAWPLGFVAILAGWTVTETGRQPWIVYGVLRTAQAVSPVTAAQVVTSLALFVLVYVLVFSIGVWYISRMIGSGPQAALPAPDILPNRPLAGGRSAPPAQPPVLLLALIFRGVAFEFRWVAGKHQRIRDGAFAAGSTLAAFAQGVILGGLLQEIRVRDGQFAGAPFDWLTPFALMCGLGLVNGYALLGASWLQMKTEGEVEGKVRRMAPALLAGLLGFIALVSVWTPLQIPRIAQRWFSMPNMAYLALVPVATALSAWLCWRGIRGGRGVQAFAAAVGLFLLAVAGLVLSNMPYVVPPALTVWQAASHPGS